MCIVNSEDHSDLRLFKILYRVVIMTGKNRAGKNLACKNLIAHAILILSVSVSAIAAPFIPTDDAQVLERLRTKAADPALLELRQLRRRLADNPNDLERATHLAQRYIEYGRAEGDPRYYGYAQAALNPWWNLSNPPAAVLLLRATLRQARHDFNGALADLSAILKSDPDDAQAWLTQASLQQVQADYPAAKKSCLNLLPLTSELIATSCLSQVTSLGGQAEKSYQLLHRVYLKNVQESADQRVWVLTLLAEMAVRLGHDKTAEQHFKQALALGLRDIYLLAAYSDFLLDQGRAREVVTLLQNESRADALLLRLALAEKILGKPTLAGHMDALRARFAASGARADSVHQREEARYTLHLLEQPKSALLLAEKNWAVQREPDDARILLEAALAAGDIKAAQPVLEWMGHNKVEDKRLTRLQKAAL